jgi:type 1 fimbria pilin
MKKGLLNFKALLLVVIVVSLSACSLQNKIMGTWQITNFSETNADGSNSNSVNIGTIEFKQNGTGINNLEYKMMGTTKTENSNFQYNVGDKTVTIKSDDENSLAKSWIVIESKAKSQKWKSTDGGSVQTIELEKQ